MPKLHEVIAVEQSLQAAAKKINDETVRTFGKKDEHFVETTREVTHFGEEDAKLNTTETKAMVTTVFEKLMYTAGPNIRALNVFGQKEATNQVAKADLVVGDVVLLAAVPATVLLGLETKLAELRAVYDAIPTLPPGPTWEPDASARTGGGVYKTAAPEVTFRTKKIIKPIVMAPATVEHPAQVQAISEDIPVAKVTVWHRNGMITSAQKSDLLERLDKLLRAVKRARQRANSVDVVKCDIGAPIFNYLHEGIVA